jgi:D-threonate/D-erythronate kinase
VNDVVRVGIVADDLTGAADTAAQFVRAGWDTELQLRPGRCAAQAIAITTDSRGLSGGEAALEVAAAVEHLRGAGATHLYKKMDSTLRGQIRAEVQATLESWSPQAIAVVCPAFPAMGRTISGGRVYVGGVLVTETAAARDPVTPVTESHLPTLLGATHIARAATESSRQLAGRLGSSGRVVVVDAGSEHDLQQLAEAVVQLGPNAVPVGSAGLARHIATAWAVGRPAPPAVVIVTSLQDAARSQVLALAAAGADHVEPAPGDLVDDVAWMRWSSRVLAEFDQVKLALLLTAPSDRSRNLAPALIPRRFAELASRLLHMTRPAGLVVTGGDGARALFRALHATGIKLRDEVTTGVPFGTLVDGQADGMSVVTKAGGFGSADVLIQAVHAIRLRRYA